MKRITYLASASFVLLTCTTALQAQKKGKFSISANIEGLADGTPIYLITGKETAPINSLTDTIATTTSKGGKFRFKGEVANTAKFHMITIDKQKGNLQLVLGNDKVTINGKLDEWTKAAIKGSSATDDKEAMVKGMDDLKEKKASKEEIEKFRKEFIAGHTNSFYIPFIIAVSNISADEKQLAYNNLTPAAKASYYGTKLVDAIAKARKMETVKAGALIPDFNITTTDGKKTTVRDVAAKSKYTLIDFWASWCGPCRAAIPHIKEVYEELHGQGFNVLGVSVDKKEADWRKALAEDKAPWVHGLQGEDRPSDNLFGIYGIPSYILVDNEGKLVAFSAASNIKGFGPDISGEELSKTIKDLLSKK